MADHAIDIAALRAEENFVADAQLLLHETMLAKNISRSELAGRLNVSRARISQLFSSECRNFTIRLLARAMHALGETPALSCGLSDERKRARHMSHIAIVAADPAANVVALWSADGEIVPPADQRGDRRSDTRMRAFLQSHAMGKTDSEKVLAVAA